MLNDGGTVREEAGNKAADLQAIVRACVRAPQRSKAAGSILQKKTIQALGISSFGSDQRLTSRALEEREKIAAGNNTEWKIYDMKRENI